MRNTIASALIAGLLAMPAAAEPFRLIVTDMRRRRSCRTP